MYLCLKVALNSIEAILKQPQKDKQTKRLCFRISLFCLANYCFYGCRSLLANMQLPEVCFLIRFCSLLWALFTYLEITNLVWLHYLGDIPEKHDAIKVSLVHISTPEPSA